MRIEERDMAAKRDPEDKIIDAALKLAASRGWSGLSLADIAKSARVGLPVLSGFFASKSEILAAFSRRIDAAVLKAASAEDLSDEAARDRLFDVLMMRFDTLAPYKPALKRISRDMQRDPVAAAGLVRAMLQSLGWMLEAAGIDSSGLAGAMRVRGIALIWGAVFRTWLEDGDDQARTMAELDRRLRRGEALLERLSRFGRREAAA